MRFFLDTVDADEARRAKEWGLLDGAVVRADAVLAAGRDYRKAVSEISQVCDGPVFAAVAAGEPKGMYKEARELAKLGKAIVVRLPMTREGLRVVRLLNDEQIAADVHLLATPLQALLAARAGAAYASVAVSGLDGAGQVGMDVVDAVVRIYDNYGLQTQIVVDAVQNPVHALDAAAMGADAAAIPYPVLDRLFDHPLTAQGVAAIRAHAGDGPRRVH